MEGSIAEIQERGKLLEKIDSKVGWSVFVWAIGIVTLLTASTGAVSLAAQNKAEVAIERISTVEGDIKAMNVKLDTLARDILWIRNKLENGK